MDGFRVMSMAEAAPMFGNQVNLLMRGAPDISANGLLRFYLLHVVMLPLSTILLLSIHYYKVSREHGISQPARIEEGKLDDAQAVLVIDEWQQDLVKVTPRIVYSEAGQSKTYEKHIYIHRQRGSE